MGFKTNNSHVDTQLSKMEVAVENIVFLVVVGNLAINETTMVFLAKVAFAEEPKWTMLMAKNVR
jgi:hypothetical protein